MLLSVHHFLCSDVVSLSRDCCFLANITFSDNFAPQDALVNVLCIIFYVLFLSNFSFFSPGSTNVIFLVGAGHPGVYIIPYFSKFFTCNLLKYIHENLSFFLPVMAAVPTGRSCRQATNPPEAPGSEVSEPMAAHAV